MSNPKSPTAQNKDNNGNLWNLGRIPSIDARIPNRMHALTLERDKYGPPADVIRFDEVDTPRLTLQHAGSVLVAILATGPNFNTNFAALGLPVPVFGRGDSATLHIPGSDAVGIVVDAGPAVKEVKVGSAVILDSWTGNSIRGYETHDGFNAQFALVDEERAIPIPASLGHHTPEQLAAMLLTYGTAYRAVVERLAVKPGDSMLVMGGGKGTSFAGAQIGKALGARVILMGSNSSLGESLVQRGIADAFVNRREIPGEVYGVLEANEEYEGWLQRTQPFRDAVFAANDGKPVDKVFEHTGGLNFPLLTSVLSERGSLAFFGATGQGLKGEYKESFYYDKRRFVMDARWVWMRQKQLIFRQSAAEEIFSEIGLPPGRRGLVWGADDYAVEFVKAAQNRNADLVFLVSAHKEQDGIAVLKTMGITDAQIIDLDKFKIGDDMPDPLTPEGTPNSDYHTEFMLNARALGKAIWSVFGPRISPDFIIERADQSTLHYSTFLLRDHDEQDEMPSGYIILRGSTDVSILGSHMYRASQAAATVRLLAEHRIVMDQEDLEIVSLEQLPRIQQKMLDGTMEKPKGVALVQAGEAGKSIAHYESAYLGETLQQANPAKGVYIDLKMADGIGVVTLTRPDALNALSEELVAQLAGVVDEVAGDGTLAGKAVRALIIRGAGRSFVAGADIEVFIGKTADAIEKLAIDNMAVFSKLENLSIPVISLVDGFALGGGNELAMSTHYRIVTENAQLGQPEVKLGLIPGYGGMQRLPRLLGPRRALEMAVNGEPVDAHTAVAMGLAHEFHPSATGLARAFQIAQEFISGVSELPRSDWDTLSENQLTEYFAMIEDADVKRLLNSPEPDSGSASDILAARSYAARMAIQALVFGYDNGFAQGVDSDARLFGEIVASPSGQEWAQRFLDKDPMQSSFMTLIATV